MTACSVVDLPAPFGPISPTISPRPTASVRSRTAATVPYADLDRVEGEQRLGLGHPSLSWTALSPRYAAVTSRFARTSAGVPSASVRPWSSTWIRSHTAITSAMLWSIRRTPARVVVAHAAHDVGELGHLRLGQPGRRLVHEQEPRLRREGAGDAEAPLVPVGQ